MLQTSDRRPLIIAAAAGCSSELSVGDPKLAELRPAASCDALVDDLRTQTLAEMNRQIDENLARALAGQVDAFYVIGGRHSSNSVKLLAVCQEQCERSFLIETADEINADDLTGVNRVGVTAGASTPNWLIEQVVKKLRAIGSTEAATVS